MLGFGKKKREETELKELLEAVTETISIINDKFSREERTEIANNLKDTISEWMERFGNDRRTLRKIARDDGQTASLIRLAAEDGDNRRFANIVLSSSYLLAKSYGDLFQDVCTKIEEFMDANK